jgi:hypothetical protein
VVHKLEKSLVEAGCSASIMIRGFDLTVLLVPQPQKRFLVANCATFAGMVTDGTQGAFKAPVANRQAGRGRIWISRSFTKAEATPV